MDTTDVNEKINDGSHEKLQLRDFETIDLKASISTDTITAEQISTAGTESRRDISLSASKTTEIPAQSNLHNNTEQAVSFCSLSSVEKDQPKPLCDLLPSSMEACTVYEVSQSLTSDNRSQESFKTTIVQTDPDREDLCAAILLACLFCHPLDCLLATMRGCNKCIWSLCSSLCGCEPTTLQPLLDITHNCDRCGCLGVRCFLCDCPICNICLQATECLDLAMEMSQMLYH